MRNKNDEHITLEDLMKMNLHNRKMTVLLISGLIFIMISILGFVYVTALENTTNSTRYSEADVVNFNYGASGAN